LPRAATWHDQETGMVDVQVFGEIGIIPMRRGPAGRPGAVSFGPLSTPRGTRGGVVVGEIRPTPGGTVAMRGLMVPRCPFPAGVERTSLPHLKVDANGFVDTGYTCWSDRDHAPLVVTGPPPAIVSVGGYRFIMRNLLDTVAEIDPTAMLAALPDAHAGHRLAGTASDRTAMRRSLAERGVSPLLVDSFRKRQPDRETLRA
jgi:hypothetical protein